MKPFVRSVLLAGACLAGVTGLMAQAGSSPLEQWYRAKTGHPTPAEDARLQAERAKNAVQPAKASTQIDLSWIDQHMQRKQGQYTPTTEAELRTERESQASRAEQEPPYQPEAYMDTWLRVKQGVVRSK